MRRTVTVSVALAFAVLLVSGVWGSAAREAAGATAKPNIVFILADDMRRDDLRYMPKTRSVLGNKGMSFSNAFVSNPLCCPTRATIMRGQYAHNTGVWTNKGSSGGLQAYRNEGNEKDNMATRLDAAGYRTGLFGKYLNEYSGTSDKPRGWDRWFAHTGGSQYYDYKINDDGRILHYGSTSADYETDVIADHAKTFIGTSAKAGEPFFAFVAPRAPHSPATPATRDQHAYDGLKAQRLPSFNEKNVSDKPPWIRKLPMLSDAKKAKIDNRAEKRAETLQSLDDLVAGIVSRLNDRHVLSKTYIFFTSDNGWHAGEHRMEERHPAGSCSQLFTGLQRYPHERRSQVRGVRERKEGAVPPRPRPLRAPRLLRSQQPTRHPGKAPQEAEELCCCQLSGSRERAVVQGVVVI